jgi:hypothetical protein
MIRVCLLMLLPLLSLAACADKPPQAPANSWQPVTEAPAEKGISDCVPKPSLADVWACFSKNK